MRSLWILSALLITHILALPPLTSGQSLTSTHLTDDMKVALQWGRRLNKWIQHLNTYRDSEHLLVTKNGAAKGRPIENPMRYSSKIISEQLQKAKERIPTSIQNLLQDPSTSFPNTLSVTDDEFRKMIRNLKAAYSWSSRWIHSWPDREKYADRGYDVRGFYALRKQNWSAKQLQQEYVFLNSSQKQQLQEHLIGICLNATLKNETQCQIKLQNAIQKNQLDRYYHRYFPVAQQVWDSYFTIRPEYNPYISRISENEMQYTFQETNPKIQKFIQTSVETRWKNSTWKIKVKFSANYGTQVHFAPGQTAYAPSHHEIYFDQNDLLDDPEIQHVFAHEFGHLLGFQDCYVELYDESKDEFLVYELDTTNIMCSGAGKVQTSMIDQLRERYRYSH